MPSLLRDGEWELIERYDSSGEPAAYRGRYVVIHKCHEGAFSWEEGPQWTATTRIGGECMACGKMPPKAMQGFVTMLEWEQ